MVCEIIKHRIASSVGVSASPLDTPNLRYGL